MWLRAPHPQLSTGGSVMRKQLEPCGSRLWEPSRTVSRKIKLDTNCLGTKLSYECTTNRQQRNGPSQNGHIQKVSSRWPWDTDESSEKQMWPAPHLGPQRDVPVPASFPSRQCGALVTALILWLTPISHSGGLRGSEWHSAASPT